ncbi:hypothetical protein HOY80DRAFT_994812 [Tuber brumale]|nr:hypothetical protein HOY80DRAFT_994812 [Tuber brumale]
MEERTRLRLFEVIIYFASSWTLVSGEEDFVSFTVIVPLFFSPSCFISCLFGCPGTGS